MAEAREGGRGDDGQENNRKGHINREINSQGDTLSKEEIDGKKIMPVIISNFTGRLLEE